MGEKQEPAGEETMGEKNAPLSDEVLADVVGGATGFDAGGNVAAAYVDL